jgi:hypothetical protein
LIDQAIANDLWRGTVGKRLEDDATQHRLDVVLAFTFDRSFRWVQPLHDTSTVWNALSVGFLSAREGVDTIAA